MNCPIFVSRTLSGSGLPFSSKASRMVLNLMILNGIALYPVRSCRKKTFPLLIKAKDSMVNPIKGNNSINKNNAAVLSKRGFKTFLYKLILLFKDFRQY